MTEQDVGDINHLHYLIKSRQIGQDSLIWDDDETRWIPARDHEFFGRIQDIAAETPAIRQSYQKPPSHKVFPLTLVRTKVMN